MTKRPSSTRAPRQTTDAPRDNLPGTLGCSLARWALMSAFGPQQTWPSALHMSAFGGKADVSCTNVRFAHLSEFIRLQSFRRQSVVERGPVLPGCCPSRFERDTFATIQKILSKLDA